MKLKSKFLYLPFLLLSACSDVPSSGDVEDSIGDLFAECKPITIEKITKTNGRPLENGNYLVNAEINLKITPIEENVKLFSDFTNKLKIYNELTNRKEENDKQILEAMNEVDREYERRVQPISGVEGKDAERSALLQWKQSENEKLRQQRNSLYDEYRQESENLGVYGFDASGRSITSKQANNFDKVCKTTNSKLARDLKWKMVGLGALGATDNQKSAEILANETTSNFTMDFEMVKTENGWQWVNNL